MKKKQRAMDQATQDMLEERQKNIQKLVKEYGSLSINTLLERFAEYETDITNWEDIIKERDDEIMELSKEIDLLAKQNIELENKLKIPSAIINGKNFY